MSTTHHESIWFTGSLVRVLIDAEQTGGAYAVLETLVPPGAMPPPHVHAHEAEGFVVLEGEVTLHTPAGARVLRPGEAGHSPAGEPHTFQVTSAGPARMLLVSTPGSFVAFVRAAGVPAGRDAIPTADEAPVDLVALTAAAEAHGITWVGAPGTVPALTATAVPA